MNNSIQTIPWSKGDPAMLFNLDYVLDEGAFGVVWKGSLKNVQNDVAIKMMPMKEEVVDELKSEINFLKEFDSPFVIHYYGTWYNKRKNEIWIVMELAELGSFEGIKIFCEYNFTEEQLAALFARVLLALNYIHGKGLIHQDIKAKNILLTLRGEVKLADFGVAASTATVNQNRTQVSGSPHWMAPEILQGTEISQKSDIWSLGITMLELTEGQPPHADIPPLNVIAVIPARPAPTFSTPRKWSNKIKAFLVRMVEKDPSKRRSSERLMKHPFVREEVQKAHKGDNELLRKVAEECIEEVQAIRNEIDPAALDFGDVETEGDFYDSEYSESSSEDDAAVIIQKGAYAKKNRRRKSSKKETSFASVVVDEKVLYDSDEEKRMRAKMRKNRTTRAGRTKHTRRTTAIKRTKSVYSQTQVPAQFGVPNQKVSMLLEKRKKLDFNLKDLRKEKHKNQENKGKMSAGEEQEREETIKKAALLLDKLSQLTVRKY